MSDWLRTGDRGGVRVLVLPRGKANALTAPLCEAMPVAEARALSRMRKS